MSEPVTSGDRSLIRCRDLVVGYRRDRPLVHHVDLDLARGQTMAVVGASGCGKTTLLKTLAGILPPLAGEARVLGAYLPARPPRGRLGYIPQSLGLVNNGSVLRNVLLGRAADLGVMRSLTGAFPRETVDAAHEALTVVGLEGKATAKPRELSGGERRRVAIARAVLQRPDALLADEILSELDVGTASTVVESLQAMQRETGMAVLMVEHNLDVAWEVADEVLGLRAGEVALRIETAGTPACLEDLFHASA